MNKLIDKLTSKLSLFIFVIIIYAVSCVLFAIFKHILFFIYPTVVLIVYYVVNKETKDKQDKKIGDITGKISKLNLKIDTYMKSLNFDCQSETIRKHYESKEEDIEEDVEDYNDTQWLDESVDDSIESDIEIETTSEINQVIESNTSINSDNSAKSKIDSSVNNIKYKPKYGDRYGIPPDILLLRDNLIDITEEMIGPVKYNNTDVYQSVLLSKKKLYSIVFRRKKLHVYFNIPYSELKVHKDKIRNMDYTGHNGGNKGVELTLYPNSDVEIFKDVLENVFDYII